MTAEEQRRLLLKLDQIQAGIERAYLREMSLRKALYNLVMSVEFHEANRGVEGIKYAKVGEPGILSIADALQEAKDTLDTVPRSR